MHVLMFLGGWRWGGVCGLITFSCTSVHKSCYAAVYVLLQVHTCIMLRCCKVSCAFTHLRENNLLSLGQALDKQWVWVKILIPRQLCAHTIQTRLSKTLAVFAGCCVIQNHHRQAPQQSLRIARVPEQWGKYFNVSNRSSTSYETKKK